MHLVTYTKEQVSNLTYIKLAVNKTHMGPVSASKVAKDKASKLSAAANKVKLAAGFKVSILKDQTESAKAGSYNQSWVFRGLGDDSPMQTSTAAVFLMQAWDNIFGDEGTPEYVEKLARATEARATAYSKLGINPASGKKPILSADQRVLYNSIVGTTSFDYYEYHIAFKLAGQLKFVRSKTYRSIRPLDINQMINKLNSEVQKLSEKMYISTVANVN